MKKLVLLMAFLCTMGNVTNANEVKKEAEISLSKYNFDTNYKSLGKTLGLDLEQKDEFEIYYDSFKNGMKNAASVSNEVIREIVVKNALDENLKSMRSILTDRQYKIYLSIINVTFINRGIKINS